MFIRKGEPGILGHNSNVMCVHRQDTVTPLWAHHCFLPCPPVSGVELFLSETHPALIILVKVCG